MSEHEVLLAIRQYVSLRIEHGAATEVDDTIMALIDKSDFKSVIGKTTDLGYLRAGLDLLKVRAERMQDPHITDIKDLIQRWDTE